jgi:hypothetical protein
MAYSENEIKSIAERNENRGKVSAALLSVANAGALGLGIANHSDSQVKDLQKELHQQASEHVQTLKETRPDLTTEQLQVEFHKKQGQEWDKRKPQIEKIYQEHKDRMRTGALAGAGIDAGAILTAGAVASAVLRRREQEADKDNSKPKLRLV